MRILFRADASDFIGTGHVMRCLTLARTLMSRGHSVEFVCRSFTGNMIEAISGEGFIVHSLSAVDERSRHCWDTSIWLGTDPNQEVSEIRQIVSIGRYDWIVVDHYGIDVIWHRAMRDKTDHILVIDDLCANSYDCDVVLNQNCGVSGGAYDNLIESNVTRLIGTEYALLRDEFSTWRSFSLHNRRKPEKDRVLVSMGGVDLANATSMVLTALNDRQIQQQLHIEVIVGSKCPHIKEITRASCESRHSVNVYVDPVGIAKMMADADIGIGAAGSTTWERCCMGLPSFQVVVADNQRYVCNYLASVNAVIGYDNLTEMLTRLPCDFSSVSSLKLVELSEVSRLLCDGVGSSKVACLMEEFKRLT